MPTLPVPIFSPHRSPFCPQDVSPPEWRLILPFPSFLPGLPANAKTSGDYMEGLFDVADDAERRPNGNPGGGGSAINGGSGGRKRYGKNFSPVALKNRIEVLQNESKK